VKVFWRKDVVQEVAAESATIPRFRDGLAGLPFGMHRAGQAHLGEMIAEAMESKRRKVTAKTLAAPQPVADRVVESKITPHRVILNGALLVGRGRERESDQMVDRLDRKLGETVLSG